MALGIASPRGARSCAEGCQQLRSSFTFRIAVAWLCVTKMVNLILLGTSAILWKCLGRHSRVWDPLSETEETGGPSSVLQSGGPGRVPAKLASLLPLSKCLSGSDCAFKWRVLVSSVV